MNDFSKAKRAFKPAGKKASKCTCHIDSPAIGSTYF